MIIIKLHRIIFFSPRFLDFPVLISSSRIISALVDNNNRNCTFCVVKLDPTKRKYVCLRNPYRGDIKNAKTFVHIFCYVCHIHIRKSMYTLFFTLSKKKLIIYFILNIKIVYISSIRSLNLNKDSSSNIH